SLACRHLTAAAPLRRRWAPVAILAYQQGVCASMPAAQDASKPRTILLRAPVWRRKRRIMFRVGLLGAYRDWSCPPSGGGRSPRRPPPRVGVRDGSCIRLLLPIPSPAPVGRVIRRRLALAHSGLLSPHALAVRGVSSLSTRGRLVQGVGVRCRRRGHASVPPQCLSSMRSTRCSAPESELTRR